MATVTTTLVSTVVSTLSSASATATERATPQAGVLESANPSAYDAKNPIILFIIQAAIIIIFCRLLYYPLRLLGQPRVIAEVLGGILLGPSVMMRIPGFQQAIFPAAAMPVLSNVANLGLILFLFLTALEVDLRMFMHNWKVALSVGLAGMALPFGLGVAIAWGLYHQFHEEGGTVNISFGVFGLFIGTALSITAFPVLCRILVELKLLSTSVGVTVLAAGVGNDVVGWILLALCVSLVNNASGLAALWALLCCVAWTLFLVFAVRPAFIWVLRRSGSLQNGPTQGMVTLTFLLIMASAWFTGIIGVHPIFGGFLVGIICPHDGGFAIKLTEKIEDFVSVLFLPLYFALSGLSTNLGLLNDGITWAYVIGVIACAFSGKIIGGTLAARFCKLQWRESFSIGVLMSCKGLVELIVLNIGLQAKILSQRTFTMFVVMALVTTVATSPLTKVLYPPSYQQKLEKWRRGETDEDGNPLYEGASQKESIEMLNETRVRRLLVYLRLDSLPSLFTFLSLLGGESGTATLSPPTEPTAPESRPPTRPLEVHGLRVLELTERTSSVMQVTEGDEFSQRDPVVNAFRTFSQLHDLAVSSHVAVVPTDSYAETVTSQAAAAASDFAIIPWSEYGSITEDQSIPFTVSNQDRFHGRHHLEFVHQALSKAACNTGIFINNGFGGTPRIDPPTLSRSVSAISIRSQRQPATLPKTDKSHNIFFPFFGGVDDRVALRFVLQLAKNRNVSATVVHFRFPDDQDDMARAPEVVVAGGGQPASPTAKSPTAGDVAKTIEEVSAQDLALLSTLQSSLPPELKGRVTFREMPVSPGAALGEALGVARETVGKNPKNSGDVVVVGRRHRRLGDAASNASHDLRGTIGVVADQMVSAAVKASLLVVQAGGRALEW